MELPQFMFFVVHNIKLYKMWTGPNNFFDVQVQEFQESKTQDLISSGNLAFKPSHLFAGIFIATAQASKPQQWQLLHLTIVKLLNDKFFAF